MKNKTRILTLFAVAALVICSSCGSKSNENSKSSSQISSRIQTSSVASIEELSSSEISSNQSSQISISSEISSFESSEAAQTVAPSSQIEQSSSESISSEQTSSIVISEELKALDNTRKGWGPGKVSNHQPPAYAVSCNELYKEYNALFVGGDNKNVYLTFDEGYENGYTAPILDTLKQKNVKAVFFVTYDYVKRNPELVKRIIDEGHILGNHSWSHPSMPSLTEDKMISEIMKLHNLVKDNYGYEMKYFRPPMGEFSPKTLAITSQLGYKSVFWSFAYVDWNTDNQPDEANSLERICNATHNGAIYLLHAVSRTNCNILGSVIDNVKQQGFTWAEFNL